MINTFLKVTCKTTHKVRKPLPYLAFWILEEQRKEGDKALSSSSSDLLLLHTLEGGSIIFAFAFGLSLPSSPLAIAHSNDLLDRDWFNQHTHQAAVELTCVANKCFPSCQGMAATLLCFYSDRWSLRGGLQISPGYTQPFPSKCHWSLISVYASLERSPSIYLIAPSLPT